MALEIEEDPEELGAVVDRGMRVVGCLDGVSGWFLEGLRGGGWNIVYYHVSITRPGFCVSNPLVSVCGVDFLSKTRFH